MNFKLSSFKKYLTIFVLLAGLLGCKPGEEQDLTVLIAAALQPEAATLTSLNITPGTPGSLTGATTQLTATGTYSDSTTKDHTASAAWSSSNSAIANVDPATGLVTAGTNGTATITADFGGKSSSITFAVHPTTNITAITVTAPQGSVVQGDTLQMTATATFSDSSTGDITSNATWSTSGPSSVDANGLVTGVTAIGASVITANKNGIDGTKSIGVLPQASDILGSVTVGDPFQPFTVTSGVTKYVTVELTGGTFYTVYWDELNDAGWCNTSTTYSGRISGSGYYDTGVSQFTGKDCAYPGNTTGFNGQSFAASQSGTFYIRLDPTITGDIAVQVIAP